jgi:hypothetical protein
VASRQQLILDRTGIELADAGQNAPMVAATLTARVLSTGAVVFNGSAGHGYPLVCSSYVMPGSTVPFYAGRRDPGASVQFSTLQFPADPSAGVVESNAPAISGTLRWNAGRDRRIATPFTADYAVLGARYTPPVDGAGLLNSAALTLSIDVPSYATLGLPVPYEDTRMFTGNILPRAVDNVSAIRVTFGSGVFLARVQGSVTRPIFGVIIQGEGINRGLGSVVDFTSLGTCELRPASPGAIGTPQ